MTATPPVANSLDARGRGVLLLETLRGNEALGMPYLFDVALLSKDPVVAPDDVSSKPLAEMEASLLFQRRAAHCQTVLFSPSSTFS